MKEYEKWFRKAESDLLTITNNLSADNIPADSCCFHAQQAAEKYLKAYMVSRNIDFPKTHDLQLLIKLIIPTNPAFSAVAGVSTDHSKKMAAAIWDAHPMFKKSMPFTYN